jgi:hypothetical protein
MKKYVEKIKELEAKLKNESIEPDLPAGCDADFMKMQFYSTCLYHNKDISKYSMTWDLDEYWTPPATLEN